MVSVHLVSDSTSCVVVILHLEYSAPLIYNLEDIQVPGSKLILLPVKNYSQGSQNLTIFGPFFLVTTRCLGAPKSSASAL